MRSFSVGSHLTKDTLASHGMFSCLGMGMQQTALCCLGGLAVSPMHL